MALYWFFRDLLRTLPLTPWLAGTGLLGLVLMTWLLLAGLKLRHAGVESPRGTRRLELAMVVTVAAFAVLAAMAVARARGLLAQVPTAPDPLVKTGLLVSCFAGQMIGIPLLLGYLAIASLLGTTALCISFCARHRLDGLRFAAELTSRGEAAQADAWRAVPSASLGATWSAAMLVVAPGLLQFLAGALIYFGDLIVFSYEMGNHLDAAVKVRLIDAVLTSGRAELERSSARTCVGLAVGATAAAVILLLSSPERARRRLLRARGLDPVRPAVRRRDWVWVVAAAQLAAAAGLFLLTRPLRAENSVPWPPVTPASALVMDDFPTPALAGPDLVSPAPVLAIRPAGVELDGRTLRDPLELEDALRSSRTTFRLLHPDGQDLAGELLLLCTPDVPASTLRTWLRTAASGGYPRVLLTFVERQRIERPMLGTIMHLTNSSASVALALDDEAPPAGAVTITPCAPRTYGDLAAQAVEERRRGRTVVFRLSHCGQHY